MTISLGPGSQLLVQGTAPPLPPGRGEAEPPFWTCAIDGRTIPASPGPLPGLHRWPLCGLPQELPEGDHVFTIDVDRSAQGSTFYVDQITYFPLEDVRDTLSNPVVIIDIDDPAVEYLRGRWSTDQGNARWSTDPDARIRVNFTGTKANWVGRVLRADSQGDSSGTYVVDGQDPVPFRIRGARPGEERVFGGILFETERLPMGAHTLDVAWEGGNAPFTFDELLVQDGSIMAEAISVAPSNSVGSSPVDPAPVESTLAGSSSSSTSLHPNSTSQTGEHESSQPRSASQPLISTDPSAIPKPSTITQTDTDNEGNQQIIGAIVGGTLGGVALLCLTILLVYFMMARHKAKTEEPHLNQTSNSGTRPALQSPGSLSHAQISPLSIEIGSTVAYHRKGSRVTTTPESSSSLGAPTMAQRSAQRIIVHHEDSGARMEQPVALHVPPAYTP
ncbi:hypothetical protein CC1G_10574 [Coprinopsis cinerea okayama7|uniref:Uncharacterized protein n=1 Tax=Coprinopsis cinerea (strain Okayama-7 / 130 / ATCC MYA-4618 / FGSC 9003) TaxID=240176 RepID=A8NDY8_COPC7|nr:hypothetical protein CC1G_10574 [Coprinopsis cinerea okayama7\|eukprot:XP_001832898.2 hypothetical protein CC1G_10574 [Coprinopsis cinerea okayama7\